MELNSIDRLDILDSNQYKNIIEMGMNSNESILQEYAFALISLLKNKNIYNFAEREVELTIKYVLPLLTDKKSSAKSKISAIQTLYNLENNKSLLTENLLIDLSKSDQFDLFKTAADYLNYIYGQPETDEDTPLNKDGQFYWLTYAEGQLTSNIPSKRKAVWLNNMIDYHLHSTNLSNANKLFDHFDSFKLHVEEIYAVYSNVYLSATSPNSEDINFTENSMAILLSLCDNAVASKNVNKIKILKDLTTGLWKSNAGNENSTIESERSHYISLKKLHNFEIK